MTKNYILRLLTKFRLRRNSGIYHA